MTRGRTRLVHLSGSRYNARSVRGRVRFDRSVGCLLRGLAAVAVPIAVATTAGVASAQPAAECAQGWHAGPLAGCPTATPPATTTAPSLTTTLAPGPESAGVVSPDLFGPYDEGCSGYYTGTDPQETHCRGTTTSTGGFRVVVRWGFWDGSNGFGWSKAYYYHNMEMPTILHVIAVGYRTVSPRNKDYEVWHTNASGEIDQEVIVVADTADNSFQGVETPDGHDVGVITGYCNDGSGDLESQCADWVNSQLG